MLVESTEPIFNEGKCFKAWLKFLLVSIVLSFVAGAVAGAVAGMAIGFVLGLSGHAGELRSILRPVGAVAGFLASLPVSYACYRWTVKKLVVQLTEQSAAVAPGTIPSG